MIFKRGDTYYYEFVLRGRRYRESTQQKNPRTARQIEAARKTGILKGEVGIKDKDQAPRFVDYAEHWIETYAKAHCKYSTLKTYEGVLGKHLIPAFSGKLLDEITRQDVADLINKKLASPSHRGKPTSRGTVRNILAPLREMLNHAVDSGILVANPANRAGRYMKEKKAAKTNRMKLDALNREEVQTLLDAAAKQGFATYAVMLTAVRTGLRMGELFGLQWGDVDFNSRFLEVRRNITRGRIETPKSGQLRRVDMSKQLAADLKELSRQKKAEYLQKGEPMPEWVFVNSDGTPLEQNNFRKRVFTGLLAKAGLRQVRFHDLRHTFASLLLQQGESPTYVKEQMGHHSIQVTVDIYGHLIPGSNKQAVDRLDYSPAHVSATA